MDRAAEDLDPSDHLLQVPHPGGAGGVLEELLQERGGGDVRDDQQARTREERQVQEYHETLDAAHMASLTSQRYIYHVS